MRHTQEKISTEAALRLLTEPQRRRILHRMAETSDETAVDQLQNALTGADTMTPNGNADTQHIELHHVHLPKLQEANVIEYDTSRGIVQRGPHFQDVYSLLQVIDAHREEESVTHE